jgi:hypothetical protein
MALRFAVIAICLAAGTGCTSIRITPDEATVVAADSANGNELRRVILAIDVGEKNQIEQQSFTDAIRRTGLFKSVTVLMDRSIVDVVLSQMRHEYPLIGSGFQCFEPYLLVATVGLIPSVCEGTHTLSFVLRPARGGNGIAVREVFAQKFVRGWAAVPLNLSSRWKHEGALEQFLSQVFLARREEILKLVSSNSAWQADEREPPSDR